MGLVDSLKSASVFTKVAFVLLLLAAFCSNLGFTTTAWGRVPHYSGRGRGYKLWTGYGLWRICTESAIAGVGLRGCTFLDGTADDWFGAVQAFSVFGFTGINVALLLIILYIWVDGCGCKGNKENCFANAILCIVTGLCYFIAVCIFGAKWNADLSWSFGFVIVAFILEIIAGILLFLEGKGGAGVTSTG